MILLTHILPLIINLQESSEYMTTLSYSQRVYQTLGHLHSDQTEYLQAVAEFLHAVEPVLQAHPEYEKEALLERLVHPERIIIFRVPWVDDQGQVQVNTGYRVQHSSLIGPYKGGLRFDPTVNLSIMKFLAFEQTFKNSLTGLPIGGGKGGADFNPRGRSNQEIMRFCQSFMTELSKHISQDQDVPAGDIGVGEREIGYLYGQYKRLQGIQLGVLTGKPRIMNGSLLRPQATGYGLVYFTQALLAHHQDTIEGKRCLISGTGNVGYYTAEKALALGGKVMAMSNITGSIYDPEGIDLDLIRQLNQDHQEDLSLYPKTRPSGQYSPESLWNRDIPADIALPCATQNEIDSEQARKILANGVKYLIEGANMPSTSQAIALYNESSNFIWAPSKAANAGGVAVSALEMSQNSLRDSWTAEAVDQRLQVIMNNIFLTCLEACQEYELGHNYAAGADIASFKKISQVLLMQGVV